MMKNLVSRIASQHMKEDAVAFDRTFRIRVEHQLKERTMTASFTPVTELQRRNKWRKKIVYAGLFIDETTKANLIRWWNQQEGTNPLHEKQLAHHLTIAFKPSQEDVENMPLGKPVKMTIIGYGQDEKAQAIFVKIEGGVRSQNAKPHVTMAISSSGAAKDSNDLEIIPLKGHTFTGVFGYNGKGKDYKEIAWEAE
jgi:hypothetical protein